jgi:hypothetical protein
MTDDVNDAAWILVHCCADLAPAEGRWPEFSVEERVRLLDKARLYVAVAKRYDSTEIYGHVNLGADTVDLLPYLGLLPDDEEVSPDV